MNRECGACTLCCKLLPVVDKATGGDIEYVGSTGMDKKAGERCRHQSHGKGCAVYGTSAMPACCSFWSCRWLTGDDTADLPRPDRAHYVVDIMPDFIRVVPHDGSPATDIPVIQVWVDPAYRDAHRDPALRRYLARQAEKGFMAVIRFNSSDGFVLAAPRFTGGDWIEKGSSMGGAEHSHDDKVAVLGDAYMDAIK